ncbi:MAG: hypothetical protein K2X38_24320 [Gemmataceae bacterium]|nr:hypothetical protein [Gemmataceae bacterium]
MPATPGKSASASYPSFEPSKRDFSRAAEVPFEAIAPIERLKQIRIVQVKETIRFRQALNVNTITMTWDGLQRVKYVENIPRGGFSKILLIDDMGWMAKETGKLAMKGEVLGFYQNFNYVPILSNLVALADERFEITKTDGAQIRNKDCFGIRVRKAGHPDIRMYFDRDAKLLVKASFDGRFLDGDLKLARDSTHVEFYFSDYRNVNGVKHWHFREQWRDGRPYSESTITEIQFFSQDDPSLFSIPEIDEEVGRTLREAVQFQEALKSADKFLRQKSIIEAKAALAIAKLIRPDAPELFRLMQDADSMEAVMVDSAIRECAAATEKEAFDVARNAAQLGLRIRPDEAALLKWTAVLDALESARNDFKLVDSRLASANFDVALEHLRKSAAAFDKRPEEARVQALYEKTLLRFGTIGASLAKSITEKAVAKQQEAEAKLRVEEFPASLVLAKEAKSLLSDAENALQATKQPRPAQLEEAVRQSELLLKKSKAFVASAAGKDLVNQAVTALKDPGMRNVVKAKRLFEKADLTLLDAEPFDETRASTEQDLAKANIKKLTTLLQPLSLDFAKDKKPDDWQATAWSLQKIGSHGLIKTTQKNATILTPKLQCPPRFRLRVEFALMTERGAFCNENLKFYEQMLTVAIVPEDGSKGVSISLGKDQNAKVGRSAHAEINGKSRNVDTSANPGPVEILLVRDGSEISINLAGRDLGSVSCASAVNRLRITARNGLNVRQEPLVFVGVSHVSLAALELDE